MTRRAPGRARWVAGTAAAAALLMFCYLRIAGVTQVNSDGAGLAWQAWDVLHGNVLLHGWWATDVAFYTTEMPEYLVVTAGAGLRPEVVHICSAITYTLLVLLAAFVARGRARGAQGLVRALIAAVVILVPQPVGPTLVLLGNPDHVGTGVPVLVLLLLLDWAEGRRARAGDDDAARRRGARALWWVPAAAGLLLAWSIIGDPLIEVVGAAPLFAAAALRAAGVTRSRRAAEPEAGTARAAAARRRWSAAGYELSLAAAAAASVPVAAAGNWLITRLGGYSVANPWYHLQHLREIARGLPVAVEGVLALFGADYKVSGAGNVAFALVHLIGVAIVLAGFAVAAWGLVRPLARLARPGRPGAAVPGDLVAGILVIAIAANVAAYLLEVPLVDLYTAHEIGPVLALGAALAGRVLGGLVLAGRGQEAPAADGTEADETAAAGTAAAGTAAAGTARAEPAAAPGPARAGARRLLLPALAVVLACYAVMLGIATAHKQAPPRNVGLAAWLLRHHLTSGFAPYWEASSITVDSGGQIQLLSVTDTGWHGHLAPQKWETNALLPEHMRPANFVVLSPAEKVRRAAVTASLGQPAQALRYGAFTILVWPGNLLPQFERSRKGPGPQGG